MADIHNDIHNDLGRCSNSGEAGTSIGRLRQVSPKILFLFMARDHELALSSERVHKGGDACRDRAVFVAALGRNRATTSACRSPARRRDSSVAADPLGWQRAAPRCQPAGGPRTTARCSAVSTRRIEGSRHRPCPAQGRTPVCGRPTLTDASRSGTAGWWRVACSIVCGGSLVTAGDRPAPAHGQPFGHAGRAVPGRPSRPHGNSQGKPRSSRCPGLVEQSGICCHCRRR